MKQKGTKNLTWTQRLQIDTLIAANVPKQKIAEQVGIHIRTLYYELKRGRYEHKVTHSDFWYGNKVKYEKRYSADIAQQRYDFVCTAKGRPLKVANDFEFVRYVSNRMVKEKISACAVVGEIKRNKMPFATTVSKTTLYRYIDLGLIDGVSLGKRENDKSSDKNKQAKRPPRGVSIEKRPKDIRERTEFGHWEMDCVCGPTKEVILNLTERKTRKVILFKMPDQKAASVIHCLNVLEKRYGKLFRKIFKTITVDNGSEFSAFADMQKSIFGRGKGIRTAVYYCHPYSAYERGSNERLNREIRKLVPKGTDLSKLTIENVEEVERWVNKYPRGVLGFATSEELFNNEIAAL